jgi:hypothetical protein
MFSFFPLAWKWILVSIKNCATEKDKKFNAGQIEKGSLEVPIARRPG